MLEEFENQVSDLLQIYAEKENERFLYQIEDLFKNYLKKNHCNVEILIRFAIFEYEFFLDDYMALRISRKAAVCKPENLKSFLIMALISFSMSYKHKNYILQNLDQIIVENNVSKSLIAYAKALYWKAFNEILFIKYLKKSVEYCDSFVWNNYKLGEIYLKKGNIKKAKELTEKALRNIQYVYPYPSKEYNITPAEELINERLKGIYITQSNLKFIQEQLEEINQKL